METHTSSETPVNNESNTVPDDDNESSSDTDDSETSIDVDSHKDFFYEAPNKRRYYLLGEEVKFEEDQTHEFKGHQNICTEQIPPWCYNKQDKSNRTRSAASRNICGFLNTGLGGTVYIGIINDGIAVGVRLTPYQQDHLVVSLHDAVKRFRPPVPKHMYNVRFVPVIDSMKTVPKDGLPAADEVRCQNHVLRTHVYCWCDYESLSRYFHGLIPMNYIVEITVLPINLSDKWVRELDPTSHFLSLPVFQADDAQIYMRKHTTLVKHSIRDIVEQAKEEVLVQKMDKLMEAWKECLKAEKLYTALKEALDKHKKGPENKETDSLKLTDIDDSENKHNGTDDTQEKTRIN